MRRRRWPAALALLAAVAALLSLGTWQVRRLAWKRALIAQVEGRIHAAPVVPPRTEGAADAYLRVVVRGRYLPDRDTFVRAVTERGAGFWVLTPLRTDEGFTVLVNRGFVPPERARPAMRAAGQIEHATDVTGLLRLSEPKGGFLRRNDPDAGRWYSRDIAAIARARRLGRVAPYFVDADAALNPGGLPVGGLTVIAFPNNHLVYAITWYGLALLTVGALVALVRGRRAGGAE